MIRILYKLPILVAYIAPPFTSGVLPVPSVDEFTIVTLFIFAEPPVQYTAPP